VHTALILVFTSLPYSVIVTIARGTKVLRFGNISARQILLLGLIYGGLLGIWSSASDLRAVVAFWIIILGFGINLEILRRFRPSALYDQAYWSENGLGELRFLIPIIITHGIGLVIFNPNIVR
jgi:hypothetical protein